MIHSSSSTDTLDFYEHANAELPQGRVALLDLSTDFEVFDDLRQVTYQQRGHEVGDDGKIFPESHKAFTFNNALRREISDRDLKLKHGFARISDMKYSIPVADMPVKPKMGDKLTDDLDTYVVVGWEYSTLGTRYRLWVRSA